MSDGFTLCRECRVEIPGTECFMVTLTPEGVSARTDAGRREKEHPRRRGGVDVPSPGE